MDGRKCSCMNWHKAWDRKIWNLYTAWTKYAQLEGSEEDRMLKAHELKLNPNQENYPHDAMHVYAQNVHCDEWNGNRLKLLSGRELTKIARDSKKDDCTEPANVTMHTNPCEIGNLKKL